MHREPAVLGPWQSRLCRFAAAAFIVSACGASDRRGGAIDAAVSDSEGGAISSSGGAGGAASGSGGRATLSTGGAPMDSGIAGSGGVLPPERGLRVEGNRLLGEDGTPFHGRGANLHDTRSCEACTYLPPDPEGLKRWADELLDDWGANFVRFNLWSFAGSNGFRQQWQTLTQDTGYRADIESVVDHMTTKRGVYVLVTVFMDPSMKQGNADYDSEWPTAETIPVYEALAETFHDNPKVLFGLTNEPHGPEDRNPELAERYLNAIDAIRAVERRLGSPEHVIVVQAPQLWARYLDYFVQNPIVRSNVAYEVHVYDPQSNFDDLLTRPSATLPVIVGEYGPNPQGTDDDIRALWTLARSLEIPHIAWNFHMRCPPNLLEDTASDGCGLAASTGYDFPRTGWGDMLHAYLQTPW